MPTKNYIHSETTIRFLNSGPTGSVQFSPEGLPDQSGAYSAPYDFGSGIAHASAFKWRAWLSCSGVPASGSSVEIYVATATSSGSRDANLSSTPGWLSNQDKRRNLRFLGSVNVDTIASGTLFINSGFTEFFEQQVSVVFWNFTGTPLVPATGNIEFQLTAVPDEIQN